MKVPHSIRVLFDSQREPNVELQKKVDAMIDNKRLSRWFYFSRLKEIESFALKVESGRFPRPEAIEDYFACTIVVPNQQEIRIAEAFIQNLFIVDSRRPPYDDQTTKPADSFRFDDLRFYVKWKPDPSLPVPIFATTQFEIQVKTFLQHAWSIATHDLIYKTDSNSWGKSRIAFQVKAMLEHVELSIQEAESLSLSNELKKDTKENREIISIITLLRELLDTSLLPANVSLLANNVRALLALLRMNVGDLRTIMLAEHNEGRGAATLNLSPYACIVQSIIRREPHRLAGINSKQGSKFRVVIPSEVEVPVEVDLPEGSHILHINEKPTI